MTPMPKLSGAAFIAAMRQKVEFHIFESSLLETLGGGLESLLGSRMRGIQRRRDARQISAPRNPHDSHPIPIHLRHRPQQRIPQNHVHLRLERPLIRRRPINQCPDPRNQKVQQQPQGRRFAASLKSCRSQRSACHKLQQPHGRRALRLHHQPCGANVQNSRHASAERNDPNRRQCISPDFF